MSALVDYDDIQPGEEIPGLTIALRRVDLIMYAGASGDFNPIHWSDRVATSAGLPGVIAHGLLTMAAAGRAVTDWCGDPGAVVSFGVRFSRPVPIPDDDRGAELSVSGVVGEKLPGRRVRIDLSVELAGPEAGDGATVLERASAVVQL